MAEPDLNARRWATFSHLSALLGFLISLGLVSNLIGPIVIWVLKKDDHGFVDDQGRESINCQLSMLLYTIVFGLVSCGLLVPVIVIWNLIVITIASVEANRGRWYRYPGIIRFF